LRWFFRGELVGVAPTQSQCTTARIGGAPVRFEEEFVAGLRSASLILLVDFPRRLFFLQASSLLPRSG